MDFPPWTYPALFATGLVAGLVDTIAGGGGLISLPVLLNLGVPSSLALGTNKFQGTFGSGGATWHYARAKIVSLESCKAGIAVSLIASAVGAWTVQQISADVLRHLIPLLLVVAVVLYWIFRPRTGLEESAPKMRPLPFYILFGIALGFYDGFFGPGTGTFWTMAFLLMRGFNLVKATGYTKAVNFASNLGSLALFIWGGNVNFGLGAAMAFGQLLGARIGSHLVLKNGAKFIRPVFLTMVLALTAKLIWENRALFGGR